MPRLLNVFDGGGNRLLSHSWSSISSDDLPFPVASLLASVHAYAGDSGWNLQHVELEYCNMTFRRQGQKCIHAHSQPPNGLVATRLRAVLPAVPLIHITCRGPQTQLLWVMLTDENEERVAKQIQVRAHNSCYWLAAVCCWRLPAPCTVHGPHMTCILYQWL